MARLPAWKSSRFFTSSKKTTSNTVRLSAFLISPLRLSLSSSLVSITLSKSARFNLLQTWTIKGNLLRFHRTAIIFHSSWLIVRDKGIISNIIVLAGARTAPIHCLVRSFDHCNHLPPPPSGPKPRPPRTPTFALTNL